VHHERPGAHHDYPGLFSVLFCPQPAVKNLGPPNCCC
jgi:hypothetical protein